jgi:hypothetical protein
MEEKILSELKEGRASLKNWTCHAAADEDGEGIDRRRSLSWKVERKRREEKRRDEKRSSSIEDVEEDFLIDEVRKK